jgi:hypothetical protein
MFFAALGQKTTAERADYLDHACGGDDALRRRVERLLEAHPQAVDFLAQPALDPHEFDLHLAAEALTSPGPTSDSEAGPWGPGAGAGAIETLDHERGDDIGP